jgi:hypothetical protein
MMMKIIMLDSENKNEMNNKINFTASSIAWTEGGIMHLSIKASTGSVIFIDWGDGRTTNHIFRDETNMSFKHDYYPKHIIPEFRRIVIC